MKKLAFLFALIICTTGVFAQGNKVVSALNYLKPEYNDLDKAKTAIDLAIEHEKTLGKAKTWKVHGQVYQAIGLSKDEKFQNLCDNCLETALNSYIKAMKLDDKNRVTGEVKVKLNELFIAFYNEGIERIKTKEFSKALGSFENSIKSNFYIDSTYVDSVSTYYAGLSAKNSSNVEKAVSYFDKCIAINFETIDVYRLKALTYLEQKDSAMYIQTLQEGFKEFPSSNSLIMDLINFYLISEQADLALEYINKGIEQDPSNHTLYFAKGTIFDKKDMLDDALKCYEKSVEIKPDYFNGYYNIGANYYNRAVILLNEANSIPQNEQAKYEAKLKESDAEILNALPHFLKAYELDSTDRSNIVTIKEIYFKLRTQGDEYNAKFEEWNEKVKNLVD